MARKRGNNYVVDKENNIAKIELHRRNKESLWTTIDLEDLKKVIGFPYTWFAKYNHTNDEYYVVASVYHTELQQSRPIFLHQYIMGANGKFIDHKNNDSLDNRKSNLRIIENSNNLKNRKSKNKNNKSGYRNVSLINGKWVVQLQVDGKNKRLGLFAYDELDRAGRFAEEMRLKYYGKFAGRN